MRKLLECETRELAEQMRWYLHSQGVDSWLEEDDIQEKTIWILSEHKLEFARQLLHKFHEIKDGENTKSLIVEAKKKFKEDKKREEKEKKVKKIQAQFEFDFPVTLVLIVLSLVIFYLDYLKIKIFPFLSFSNDPTSFLFRYKTFREIAAGELWRLVTPIFIHGGMMHILFNMLWLFQLGRIVELVYSSKRLIQLVVVSAVVSHIAFYLTVGPSFGGMSGVIYCLCAYLWFMDSFAQIGRAHV